MELRQVRALQAVVANGSIGQAAAALQLSQSTVSEQIAKLESELAVRLLQRTPTGATPTVAGIAFLQRAQLALRHLDEAQAGARDARLRGLVRLGLAPTTASVLGLPLVQHMAQAYPDVRLNLVEGMASELAASLVARQLDLAILFRPSAPDMSIGGLQSADLVSETLFAMCSTQHYKALGFKANARALKWTDLARLPLILPRNRHGLRASIDAAFERHRLVPTLVAELDSLGTLMSAVDAGMGVTVQPWSAMARFADRVSRFVWRPLADEGVSRVSSLYMLGEDELSPVALATRVALRNCVRSLIENSQWQGADWIGS